MFDGIKNARRKSKVVPPVPETVVPAEETVVTETVVVEEPTITDMVKSIFDKIVNSDDTVTANEAEPTPVTIKPAPPPPKTFGMTVVKLPEIKSSQPYIIEYPTQQNTTDYDVYLYEDIGSWDSVFEKDIVNILRFAKAGSTVNFYISSCGGSLFAATAICAALLATKANTNMYATGCCASAAALIWCYGKTHTVEPGGYLMFHMSSHGDWGNSESIRMSAEDLVDYVKSVCVDPAVKIGVMTQEEATSLLEHRQDIWLDADTVNGRLASWGGVSSAIQV